MKEQISNSILERLTCLLVKNARQKKSQAWVNRSFGFKFNQVSKWERGVKKIKWSEYVRLCEICKVDLKSLLHESLLYDGRSLDWNEISNFLSKERNTVGKKLKKNRKSNLDPALVECLRTIDRCSYSLLYFLFLAMELRDLVSFLPSLKSDMSEAQIVGYIPTAIIIFCSLELDSYRNYLGSTEKFMQEYFKIDQETTKLCLLLAQEKKIVRLEKSGKYALHKTNETPDVRLVPDKQLIALKAQIGLLGSEILNKAMSSREKTEGFGNFYHLVFNANETTLEQIQQETAQYFKRIRDICADVEEPITRVGVFNIQIFDDMKARSLGVPFKLE